MEEKPTQCGRCKVEDKYPICFNCATGYERDLLFQLRNLDASIQEKNSIRDSVNDSKNSYFISYILAFLGLGAIFLKIHWLGIALLILSCANYVLFAIHMRKTGYDRRIVDSVMDINLLEQHEKADISKTSETRADIFYKILARSNMTKQEAETTDNKFKVV